MQSFCKRLLKLLFTLLSLVALSRSVIAPTYAGEAITKAPAITIYTASYCSDCKRAKAYMNAHSIAFDEHDVEFDLVSRKAFYAMGGKGVPLLLIKGQMMHGFNAQKLEKLRK